MYTPLQSLHIKGSAGDPMPVVFHALDRKGARFLRGQLALVCAGPGTGKSAFVLTYALKSAVPTMYFSADSDAFTQLSRMVAIQTGMSMDKASMMVRHSDLGEVADVLDLPIRFNYNACPTLDQIELSMEAYGEVYESYPELVIIDNITNVRAGGANDDDPFAGLEVLMEYLHKLARDTGACVIGLHHVTGKYNDAAEPIPLSGVKGQISRIPELILTMHRVTQEFGSDSLRVSTVKNRAGRADPSGLDFIELEFVGDSMQIRDFDTNNI
jgi:RecA-family ATPase